MIGSRFTDEAGAEFEVIGQHGGRYVLQRVDAHETPQALTPAELAERLNTDPAEPPEADEQAGWEVLAKANAKAALRLANGDMPAAPSPEEALAAHEQR